MSKDRKDKLTVRQQRFAHERFEGKNGVEAVKAAGYAAYTPGSQAVKASTLMSMPKIKNYIQELMFQQYPDAPNLILKRMVQIVSSVTSKDSDAVAAAKFITELCALRPDKEPNKNVNIHLKAKDFELPKE